MSNRLSMRCDCPGDCGQGDHPQATCQGRKPNDLGDHLCRRCRSAVTRLAAARRQANAQSGAVTQTPCRNSIAASDLTEPLHMSGYLASPEPTAEPDGNRRPTVPTVHRRHP
jgi:hypothetical protein